MDPYFRFYTRHIAPHHDEPTCHPEVGLPRIREGLRSFVGLAASEELSRQCVAHMGRAGQLPCAIQEVGSHWDRQALVDVVAVGWPERAVLLGECKWGADAVDRAAVCELIEVKAPKVLRR